MKIHNVFQNPSFDVFTLFYKVQISYYQLIAMLMLLSFNDDKK